MTVFFQRTMKRLNTINRLNLIAFVLIVLAIVMVDRQTQQAAALDRRAAVQDQLGLIQARLQGNIYSNIHLVQGLAGVIMTEPDIDQARFATLARKILRSENQLRHIAAAPNLVIEMIHPLAGNEDALGLDFKQNSTNHDMIELARDTGEAVVAGPVDLVQGGVSMIARIPVFTETIRGEQFWGILSAVIDNEALYRESGLLDPDLQIDLALVGKDGFGAKGDLFFGMQSVLESDPVDTEVLLPNGYWRLLAVPKNGWQQEPGALWVNRAAMLLLGALVMAPMLVAGHLSKQRDQSYRAIKVSEGRLQRLSKRLELALDASRVGVWDYAIETNELFWDDRMRELYDIPADQDHVSVDDWRGALHPDDRKNADSTFADALNKGTPYRTEFRVLCRNGKTRHIRAKAAIHEDVDGVRRIIGLNWDVTRDIELQRTLEKTKIAVEQRNLQLEEAKAHIEHMALHDSLTGLPNRRSFDQQLSSLLDEGQGASEPPKALLVIDVDHFKRINDSFGHPAGDALLNHVAGLLHQVIRPTDFIARIGGDEFVILCRDNTERQHLTMLAQSIIAKCTMPMEFEGKRCAFGVSVGIATLEALDDADLGLMAKADLALYQAKKGGRSRFEFYTHNQRAAAQANRTMADEINRGLEFGEFVPFYQTQHYARSGRIAGVEALVRWQHPQKGLLAPAQFLDVAGEYGLTDRIDHAIFEQTVVDLKRWKQAGLAIPRASVNVSAERLSHTALIPLLEAMDFEPGTLSFELLETIFLDDFDAMDLATIDQIKALGIDFEIDDFGTGYSSIIGLLKINPARLKIDRQLILPMLKSQASRKLVKSVIEIGRSLDIDVVAEGVETAGHIELLTAMGCDLLQGYAFSRPMPANELVEFVSQPLALHA